MNRQGEARPFFSENYCLCEFCRCRSDYLKDVVGKGRAIIFFPFQEIPSHHPKIFGKKMTMNNACMEKSGHPNTDFAIPYQGLPSILVFSIITLSTTWGDELKEGGGDEKSLH